MSYTRKAIVSFGIIFACLALANIVSYLLRLVLARGLTPAEFGLVYAVFGLFGFVGFAQTLGLSDALIGIVPSLKSKQQVKAAFLTAVYTQLAVTLIIFVLSIFFSSWLAEHYFHEPAAAGLVIIYGLVVLLSPIEVSLVALFQALGKTTWYGYVTLARAVFLLLSTILLLYLGLGPVAAVLAYLLVYLLVPVVYLPLLLRTMPEYRKSAAKYDLNLLRSLFKFGLPVILSSSIGVFLTYIDTFFLTLYRTLPEVALYNVALPTAGLLWFFSGVIYSVMLPITSEMNAAKKTALLRDAIGRMYLYLLILLLPVSVVLLAFPDVILNVLFGGMYVSAALTLQLLVIGGLFYAFSNLNTSIIIGLGRPKLTLRALLAAAIVNVLLDILLIPRFGVAGSAMATLVAFIVLFVGNLLALRTLVRFSLLYSRMLRAFLAAVIFCGVLVYLRYALEISLWWKISVGMVCGTFIYVLLLFVFGVISIDEIRSLTKGLRP